MCDDHPRISSPFGVFLEWQIVHFVSWPSALDWTSGTVAEKQIRHLTSQQHIKAKQKRKRKQIKIITNNPHQQSIYLFCVCVWHATLSDVRLYVNTHVYMNVFMHA